MARYIDVDALWIGKVNRTDFDDPKYADGWNAAIDIIKNAPTADVQEVKHAWYADGKEEHICFICRPCSNCGDYVPVAEFCMWCGAKLDLEDEK